MPPSDLNRPDIHTRDEAWNAYWGEQRLAACLRDPDGNYGGCIAAAWKGFFSQLPRHARVLDLAAGNGAVALLGLQASDERGLELRFDACDAAQIDPAARLGHLRSALERIAFRGGVRAEDLPYEDGRFDAVASQYGVEYADWRQALGETARVLAPGGRLMFICHSTRSTVFATTRDQLDALDNLRDRQLVSRVVDLLNSESLPGPLHQQNLHRFRQDAAAVMNHLDRSEPAHRTFIGQYLQRLGDIYQQRREQGTRPTLEALESLDRDLDFHQQRLEALAGAALTDQDVVEFAQCLESNGFETVQSAPLSDPDDGSQLGWRFTASRSGGDG